MVASGVQVNFVLTDRPCRAAEIASGYGIDSELVERKDFGPSFDRANFTSQVTASLVNHKIDLVAMAGYGTVLSEEIHQVFALRILNTHPSLLPAFPGWHAVREAIRYGVKVSGCTVHLATPVVDDGPILAQSAVEVLEGDTETSLHERIKSVERVLYPKVIASYLEFLSTEASKGDLASRIRDFHL